MVKITFFFKFKSNTKSLTHKSLLATYTKQSNKLPVKKRKEKD